MVTIKSEKEIKLMREACRITSLVYKEIEKIIKDMQEEFKRIQNIAKLQKM